MWTARQCKKLFRSKPMPELPSRTWEAGFVTSIGQSAFANADGADS
jgi:hypothetical protein